MESILAVCREKQIFLFIDECFLDLTEDGEDFSMKPFLKENPNLLLLKAFTKSYGMAGLRLGYCLSGNRQLLHTMGCQVQPWNVSIPAQNGGIAALRQRDFLEMAKKTISEQREVLEDGLRKLGMAVIPSKTNYILFQGPRDLRERLLEAGIQIRSCANYIGLSEGWFRIAVKLPEENKILLEAMEKALKE